MNLKTLDQIEAFIVLAECKSFTETAKRLYRSQPTISNHIQQLEELFHATLFHRSGKLVQLTRQGEVLLEYAKQITRLVEEASVQMKNASRQDSTLSIYVSNYIARYFFSDILQHFRHAYPKQLLEINTQCYEDLIRSLREGKANFAFLPLYPKDEYIRTHFDLTVLFEEDFPLVLPVDHPWTNRKVIYCRDLQNESILLPQSQYLQQTISAHLVRHQVKARFLHMSNFEMIKQAVKLQRGIAFLPYQSVADDINNGKLAAKKVFSLSIKRKNGFVIRKDTLLNAGETAFCQDVEQYFCRNSRHTGQVFRFGKGH